MGGTGVGKSSLLNALVGRRHDFHGEGYNDGCFKVIKKIIGTHAYPANKMYKERRRKGAPLIMSRSSKMELPFSKNGGSVVFCTDAIEVPRME